MKNKLHISEKIENLRENLRISNQILGSLKKKTIDINFYVDSNHLKISIDSITEKLHRFSLQLCKYYQLENLKNFNLNQESYGRFTAEIFFKFLNKYQEVLVAKNSTFFPRKGSLKKLKAYGPFLTEQVFHDIIFKMDKKYIKNHSKIGYTFFI